MGDQLHEEKMRKYKLSLREKEDFIQQYQEERNLKKTNILELLRNKSRNADLRSYLVIE